MAVSIRDLWTMLTPFVAALTASALTYGFSRRGKRKEIADADRLAAFRALHERLLSLARYCDASAAEIDGGDFDERLDDLAEGDQRSALMHRNDIARTTRQWQYLLSPKARQALHEMDARLGLVCTMNLTASTEELHGDAAASNYRATAERAMACIDELYAALELPK